MPHNAQRHVDVAYITQALLQLRNQRFPVVDLRTYDRFRVERLSGSATFPGGVNGLAEHCFLLPDKQERFGVVTSSLQDSCKGCLLQDFFSSRQWSCVVFCLPDEEVVWTTAKELGLWEGPAFTQQQLRQRCLFRPCPLLEQEICRIERSLASRSSRSASQARSIPSLLQLPQPPGIAKGCEDPCHNRQPGSQQCWSPKEGSKVQTMEEGAGGACPGTKTCPTNEPGVGVDPGISAADGEGVGVESGTWAEGCPRGCSRVQVRCLEPGSGSGRNLAWLAYRRPLVSIPRDGWQQQQQQEQCPAMEPWQQHQLANGQGQQHRQGHGQPGQQQEQGLQQQSRQVQELGQHEQEERQQPGLNQASGYAAGPNQAPGCADKPEFQLPAPCLQASLPSAPAPSREQVVVELVWSVVGLDSWYGALTRTQDLFQWAGVSPDQAKLWHLSINSASGALEPLPLPDSCRGGGEEVVAPAVNTHISGQAPETLGHCCWDLILCVRFLERVFLPRLPGLLAPGGFLLFSTFLDLPGTRRFGRPKGERHLLQRSELRELFEGVHKMQVLRDDVEVSADGRELSMFLARKADT